MSNENHSDDENDVSKRENVLEELQDLAKQVEQRLQSIENSEREFEQWKTKLLETNRLFWDEYRRQVENFSSSRIRTFQYEYRLKQIETDRILKRIQLAKDLSINFHKINFNENVHFPSSFIDLLKSNYFLNDVNFNENDSIYLQFLDQFQFLDEFIVDD